MQPKSIHTACVAVVTMSLFLSACSDRDSKRPGNASTASQDHSQIAETRELKVAAASDLQFALEELSQVFEQEYPEIKVEATYGSSGNLFAQLNNRAPFDLFLSADMNYPRQLTEQGLAIQGTEFRYAVGHLVVWVPSASPLDVEQQGIQVLTESSVRKVAIANPKHAPYGRAAEAAMKHLGVYEQVKDRLVLGENIAQTAQFVETGGADVGVLALSLAKAPRMRDKGRYWMIPTAAFPTLEQGGVMLSWARDRDAANQFRSFLLGERGCEILKQYGFFVPEK